MKRDHGPFVFFALIAVVISVPFIAFSCAGTEESVPGAVIQECSVDPVSGFAQCRYLVVHTQLSCECREWWIRLTCDGQWAKFKRTCHCDEE